MVTPGEFLTNTLRPALHELAPLLRPPPAKPEAELQLLVTSIHETGLRTRFQDGGGPGRSFFQIEAGLNSLAVHPAGVPLLRSVLGAEFGYDPDLNVPRDLLRAALGDPTMDRLAVKIARLILWLDPHPLPAIGDEEGAFQCYRRTWRPGIERRDAFRADYATALAALVAPEVPSA